jgi:glutamate synthase (NADPH/NADH) large chain
MNFGAGMTGGTAWVFDEDGEMLSGDHYHPGFLEPAAYETLDAEAQESIEELVRLHEEKTASTRASWLLANWGELAPKFVRLTPKPQA